MTQLMTTHSDLAEEIDADKVESNAKPFTVILEALDAFFQYDESVDLPMRFDAFVFQFQRKKS